MIPTGTFIQVVSGFSHNRKVVKNRNYSAMPSIAVPGQTGTIIPLEVVPASDSSGTYALVVSLQDANIDIGTVDVALTYNLNPPVLSNGETGGFQSDSRGNLRTTIATPLPAGSNLIGAVDVVAALPTGTNTIGAVYEAPTSSSAFALTPGSSTTWETSHVIKSSPGNLYTLNVIAGSVDGFLMTFDAAIVPDDGPVTPIECVPVAANSFMTIRSNGSPPDHYSHGIVAVFSVTGPFMKTTTSTFGNRKYGHGLYGSDAEALACFKWSVA